MKPVIIENFQKGIGRSPHLGFGEIRNIDVITSPGIARINVLTTKRSGSVVTDLPLWFEVDPNNPLYVWALADAGKLYFSNDGGLTWVNVTGGSSGSGQGLKIWKNYLFVGQATALDTWGPLDKAIPFSAARTFIVASQADDTMQGSGDQTILQTTGTPVRVSSSGTLPAGLSAATTYWTRSAGSTLFRLYPTLADAVANTNQINLTSDGTGTHSIVVYGWDVAWQTLDSDTKYHPMIRAQNDNLYIGAGRYVASVAEVSGQTFDPTTSGTYSFNSRALDLPANYRVKCLAELGDRLRIGTWQGTNVYDTEIADIFPWDFVSSSFDLPQRLGRHGVNAMVTVNNLLYILAGVKGQLFVSNGVTAVEVAKIPQYMISLDGGKTITIHPGSIMTHDGKVWFGAGGNTAVSGEGVWSYNPDTKALVVENTISTGSDGSTTTLTIGGLCQVLAADRYLIGWKDDSTYGIDILDGSIRYTAYAAFIESPLIAVSDPLNQRQFEQVEFQLAKPLTTGQGIKIKYRTNLSASYTTHGTYDYATYGAAASMSLPADIPATEFIQVRIELTTGASSTTTPELRKVILR